MKARSLLFILPILSFVIILSGVYGIYENILGFIMIIIAISSVIASLIFAIIVLVHVKRSQEIKGIKGGLWAKIYKVHDE